MLIELHFELRTLLYIITSYYYFHLAGDGKQNDGSNPGSVDDRTVLIAFQGVGQRN